MTAHCIAEKTDFTDYSSQFTKQRKKPHKNIGKPTTFMRGGLESRI